jgi:hypothetical protein
LKWTQSREVKLTTAQSITTIAAYNVSILDLHIWSIQSLELTPLLFIFHRFPNKSVDEIHRIDNTDNYIKVDIVGITGKTAPGEFVDEKGIFSAVAPENGKKR